MKMKIVITALKKKCFVFVALFYIFMFQIALQEKIGILQYADEIFALISLYILLVNLKSKSHMKNSKMALNIGVGIFIVLMCGIIGTLIHNYQPVYYCLLDALMVSKFFLAMYVGGYFFSELLYDSKSLCTMSKSCVIVLLFFLIMTALDYVFEIFTTEIRYNFRSLRLFYYHGTFLVAAMVQLISLYVVSKRNKISVIFLFLASIIMFLTLRTKAWGMIVVTLGLYILIVKFDKKVNIGYILIGILLVLPIAFNQIELYYGKNSEEQARYILNSTSIKIMKDCFPFGTGFATFGSHFSKISYSPVYSLYGINNVWGLSKSMGLFISDTFWPMIMGQFGGVGVVSYASSLIMIFKNINKICQVNKYIYLGTILPFAYLIISSTSEASFVTTTCVPLGLLIGMGLNYNK